MHDRIRLDGRVAVVTDAAGVIGTATLRFLAERGAHIVAVDRKQPELQNANRDASCVSGYAYTVDGGRTSS
jgi:NAD(P)-dependent dehydrogenase (short-subunit alcohol dehydrogenase family)